MNYDFVLRQCDPRIGKHLAVLADILSNTSATIAGFPEDTFREEDYLDALGQLTSSALLKFTVETSLAWQPAAPNLADLILCQKLDDLRETLRERLCGVEGSVEREKWEIETATLGLLGDLVYRPAGPLPYPLRAQVEALTLLVDRVNVSYGTLVVDHPLLEPVLAQAQTLREALLTLLLNPEFCPDDEDFDDEDLEREDAEPEAAA